MFIQKPAQHTIQYDQKLRQIARGFRKNPTTAEYLLWQELRSRKLGYKFRRQHPLHGFIVDFYCHELKLVIEVDGAVHENTIERDHLKDQVLSEHGYRVIRFTNISILSQLPGALSKILSCTNPFPE